MKRKMVTVICLITMAAAMLMGCGASKGGSADTAEQVQEEENDGMVGMANPWIETDAAGVEKTIGVSFGEPSYAKNVIYRVNESDQLAEMQFEVEGGVELCARIKPTGVSEDISGMYYEWETVEDCNLKNCAGQLMSAQDEDRMVQVYNWFDAVPGISYSLSAQGEDLNGFDLLGVASDVYVAMQGDV